MTVRTRKPHRRWASVLAVLAITVTALVISPGRALAVYPGGIVIWTVGPDGVFTFGDRVLDVAGWSFDDRGRVHMWDFRNAADADNQRWTMVEIRPGYFQIKNNHSGKCLDKSLDNGNVDGALVYQFTCSPSHPGNQLWWGDQNGLNGYTRLRSAADNRCLDIRGKVNANDATVQVWGCNTTGWNQAWTLTE